MGSYEGAVLAWRAAGLAFVISGVLGLLGWTASQLFLTSLFGDEFADVPFLIGILLVGVVPFSMAKVLGNYMSGTNAVGANALSTSAILFVAIGLDLLLIPSMGAVGAAVATAVSYGLHTLLLVAIFVHKSALPLVSLVGWKTSD